MKNQMKYALFFLLVLAPISVFADIAPLDINRAFPVALIATSVIELITAYIFLSISKLPKRKILISVFLGSLITLPLVWFVFSSTLSGEIFAVVFEALFIYLVNKDIFSIKKSIILAIVINLASFLIGFSAMYSVMSLDIWKHYFWYKSSSTVAPLDF